MPAAVAQGGLEVKGLNVTFATLEGEVQAASDASLTIRPGEVLGLLGETGCGKTVLGLSLLGLLPMNARVSGSILLDGQSLLTLSGAQMRRLRGSRIAYISQDPAQALNPLLRNGTQIIEAIPKHLRKGRRSDRRLAEESLRSMGFEDPAHCMRRFPVHLSGGMRQRVLAAMGMAGAPALLIADEPTKGLDSLCRRQVVEMLRSFVCTTGCAALLITHDLRLAEALCQRIAVMYAAQIVEAGEAADVLAQPWHPYTAGLLRSCPGPGMAVMPGIAPSLIGMSLGCRFAPRCAHASSGCEAGIAVLPAVGNNPGQDSHFALCSKARLATQDVTTKVLP
jgi:peptide/nickel transport system ATP-binding protein